MYVCANPLHRIAPADVSFLLLQPPSSLNTSLNFPPNMPNIIHWIGSFFLLAAMALLIVASVSVRPVSPVASPFETS